MAKFATNSVAWNLVANYSLCAESQLFICNIFVPLLRHYLAEFVERVEKDSLWLCEEFSVDCCTDVPFTHAIEFREVGYRTVHLHVVHEGVLCALDLFGSAEVVVKFVFPESEDLFEFVLSVHLRRSVYMPPMRRVQLPSL